MAFVVEGFNPKKAVTVISEYNRQISSDIISSNRQRGSTLLSGKGAYQQNNTDVLYAVVSQSQIGTVKKIVNYDESAFLVIHDVRDVLGNGFINTK